jgi:hypothetical protein
MEHMLTNVRLKELLKAVNMSHEDFIKKCMDNFVGGHSTIRKYLSGELKIPNHNIGDIYNILYGNIASKPYKEQVENELTKEMDKHEAVTYVEESLRDIVAKAVNHFTPFEVYTFYANQNVYTNISIAAANFFAKTTDLSLDSRQEVLAFIEQMKIKAKTVRETSETILMFLDMRDYGNERTKKSFEAQCKRYTEEEIKKNRWKDIENLLNSKEFNLSKFYTLAPFFTTMDKLDWDMLIAYTLVTHEDAERAEAINQKLNSMLED